jgi:hypothetical protein
MEEYHHQYQQSEINTGKWMNGQNGGHLHYSHQQKKSTFNNNDRAAPRFGHEEQNHQFLHNSNQKHHNHHSQPQQNRQNDIYPNPSQKNHQSLLNHNLGQKRNFTILLFAIINRHFHIFQINQYLELQILFHSKNFRVSSLQF